jgi:UDP-N-acetylglucosamine diphosphorylase/glucosamine-1-phosphate N-acetyltransferase
VTQLYLLEPAAPGAAWAPFTGVRPVAELRAGLWRIRERWERALGLPAAGILGAHAEGFHEADEPPTTAPAALTGPAVVVTSAFAPSGRAIPLAPDARRLVHGDAAVGWIVPAGERFDPGSTRGRELPVEGQPLAGTYSLLDALEHLLGEDCAVFRGRGAAPAGALVLGDAADVVTQGAAVEPGVVFDVRSGPVVLEAGSEIRSGTRLEGPTFVGTGTRILGGYVRGSVFGPECRVRGEVAASVFLGYANKAHDGFVGHSVVGRWANLGAGTITSNLKNTYGPVRLDVAGERIETGRLNVGTLFGDHTKTAIGTLLPTGAVVSVGANVFGGAAPKYVPPFAWGVAGERMTEDGFLRIAERVMARREVAWTDARRESLRRIYRRAGRS